MIRAILYAVETFSTAGPSARQLAHSLHDVTTVRTGDGSGFRFNRKKNIYLAPFRPYRSRRPEKSLDRIENRELAEIPAGCTSIFIVIRASKRLHRGAKIFGSALLNKNT